jgi:amino acid adenylation domain-containing protein
MKLLKLGEHEHILLRTFHHIITDGWSQGILNRELAALYAAFNEGRPDPLEPLPVQYADFALWQRQRMDKTLTDQLSYWKKQLAGFPEELALPKDRPRPTRQTFAADVCHHSLTIEQTAALKRLCQSSQATLYMSLLSAFAALLQRYSDQDDIVVGSPIANRREEQLEKLIGFFVNSLVLRIHVDATETFGELLGRVRGTALDAYRHQDVPFERLVEELSPQRSLNKMPICQVMFLWQNAPMEKPDFKELDAQYLPVKGLQTHFDLELQAMEHGGTVHFNWIYNCGLFDRWRIEKMARHFARFLEAAVASPQTPLRLFRILDEQEQQQLLLEWNSTDQPYEAEATAHKLFERQAARTPQAMALLCGDRWITYGELNERANQLAHYLAGLGVGPEVKIGICLERGLQMFVGLLGILKAGAAYVPLDPKYPAERLSYMLEDSQALLLLTGHPRVSALPAFAGAVINLEEQWQEIATQNSSNPEAAAAPLPIHAQKRRANGAPENLAYVIYTSGSTGKPKGVAVEHRQLSNQLLWAGRALELTSVDRVLQKASFSFDVSILEMLLPLACGAGVVIAKPGGEQDLDYLVRLGIDNAVTYVDVVPALLEGLLIHPLIGRWTSLRVMTCGGEALKPHLVKSFYGALPAATLWNAYGPTETTVQSTYAVCAKEDTSVTIGSPVANTCVYVLDRWLNPLPVGVAGELYIGGAGLARGYFKRPKLTAERFIADPFSPRSGSRMYRTGDLVRWRVDGNLEFLGRRDDQVKVRGFRIELGEIESALHQCTEVEQAVVIAREDDSGEKRLAAYIVSREQPPNLDKLRNYLKGSLPDHMMPFYFIFLDRLPLTPVGKVDRLALPKPEAVSRNMFVAPRTDLEQSLARVWQDALLVQRVGLDDNFFDLGGHSLLVARIHFILREKLKREIAIVDFFTYPTVRALAQRLEETEEKPINISDSQERAARQKANLLRRRQSAGARKQETETVE